MEHTALTSITTFLYRLPFLWAFFFFSTFIVFWRNYQPSSITPPSSKNKFLDCTREAFFYCARWECLLLFAIPFFLRFALNNSHLHFFPFERGFLSSPYQMIPLFLFCLIFIYAASCLLYSFASRVSFFFKSLLLSFREKREGPRCLREKGETGPVSSVSNVSTTFHGVKKKQETQNKK